MKFSLSINECINKDNGSLGSFQAELLVNRLFGENIYTRPFEWNDPLERIRMV